MIKRLAEHALLYAGPARLARSRLRGRSLVLAYHNILPDGAPAGGDRSLHLPRGAFARQLDLLGMTHDVVPLPVLLEPVAESARPRAAITFDDAYAGAVTIGVEEVTSRGFAATIFVAPAFVGRGTFWWDSLADPESGVVPEQIRRQAIEDHCGIDGAVRAWAEAERVPLRTPAAHMAAATIEELQRAARTSRVTLASHTWSHPNLAQLPAAQLSDELTRPLAWLTSSFPNVIPWLTYPYGLATPAVERAVAAAGYEAAMLVSGGWMPRHVHSRYGMPRLNIPAGMSPQGFALRTAGVFMA